MIENFKHLPSVHCLCKDVTLILVNYTCEIMLQGYLAWIYQHFTVNKLSVHVGIFGISTTMEKVLISLHTDPKFIRN